MIFAGDTLPIEVYCHLPIMCEDRNLAYAYVPSKVVSSGVYIILCLPLLIKLNVQSYNSHVFISLFLQDLGSSAGSKRPTCVIMVKPHEEYKEAYDECLEEVASLPKPI